MTTTVISKQESHAIARKPCDAAAVTISSLPTFTTSSHAPKARLQNYRHTGTKQNLT